MRQFYVFFGKRYNSYCYFLYYQIQVLFGRRLQAGIQKKTLLKFRLINIIQIKSPEEGRIL
jgi:hypothetical protein